MLKTRILILAVSLLLGCNTSKKAVKSVEDAIQTHPEAVIPIIQREFPCIITKVDTNITYLDTTLYIDCPDSPQIRRIVTIKTISLPSTSITKYLEDSSKLRALGITLNNTQKDLVNCQKERDKYMRKYTRGYTWFLWLVIALLLSLFGNYIQMRKI